MTGTDLLAEWVQDIARDTRNEIEGMSSEALSWGPDSAANSIGVTVWHMGRWLDVLTVQVLENRPAIAEQWHTRGWAERTGYDPRGIGKYGVGAITGYTLEEVRAIPALPAPELLTYLDQTCAALHDHLLTIPVEALGQTAPGLGGTRTRYQWIKAILMGCIRHIGEVQTLKAMRERTM